MNRRQILKAAILAPFVGLIRPKKTKPSISNERRQSRMLYRAGHSVGKTQLMGIDIERCKTDVVYFWENVCNGSLSDNQKAVIKQYFLSRVEDERLCVRK